MNARVTRRLGIVAAIALAIAALPTILGNAGADEPVAVPAGTSLERDITVELPHVAPAEVVLLVDSTGSEYRSLEPAIDRIVGAAETAGAPIRIAVANVGDYPVRPFGVAGDAPYELLQPLSGDPATWSGVLDGLAARRVGGDPAEGQVGALAEAIQDGAIGFTRDATKLAIVVSDAPAHDGDDVGCDDNGTCIDYPGPMAGDVADLAAAAGVRLASLGVAHDDALRAIAPPIGAAHDGQDPLVAMFMPEQLSISPATTCDGDVTVGYEPGTITGLPGAVVTLRQTITVDLGVEGAVTCTGGPVDGLDLVVDAAMVITETDTLTDPTDEAGAPSDDAEDPTAAPEDDGAPADTDPDETAEVDDAEEAGTEADDEGPSETVDPVVASVALDIGPEPYLIDISLPLETQEALLVDGAVITETTGVVPEAGFDAELTADLTEEPFGGVIVPDPEQPLVWEYQPAGPGPDLLEYTLSDAEGVVVATITLEFTVAEAAEEEPVDEPDPETSEEEPADEPEADEPPADDHAAEEASDPDAGEGDEAAEPAPETDGDEPVEETTDDPPPADQAAEGSTAATDDPEATDPEPVTETPADAPIGSGGEVGSTEADSGD